MTAPDELRYPIGKYEPPPFIDATRRAGLVGQIASAPAGLRAAVAGLTDDQLDTPYRPGGWTVRQVVHHLPDSHLNAYVRFKLALTEDEPTIRPYDEARWAEVPEARTAGTELSLSLLDAVHRRWVACIGSLSEETFQRRFRHPELGVMSLDEQLSLYSWHGRHHTAQILSLRRRMGW
jgi:uncharacterized damage-inducible protein DinB